MAIAKCALLQTYTEVHAFLGLVGHYRRFIKGFTHIAQPFNDHVSGEGASRKSKHVLCLRGCPEGFWGIEAGMYDSPCTGLHWIYQTISARDGCIQGWAWGSAVPETGGQMLSPWSPMGAEPSPLMRRITIQLCLNFWHWNGWLQNISRSILLYQPFLVRTDNNPLTYIMVTPNLDATGHQWVRSPCMVQFWVGMPRRDVITLWQMCWTKLLLDWTQTWWNQSLMEVAIGAAHQVQKLTTQPRWRVTIT